MALSNKERELVREALDLIDAATNEGKVVLKGYGTFKKVTKKARTARNPKTGEAVEVPERVVLQFKSSK